MFGAGLLNTNHFKALKDELYKKYLIIRKSENTPSVYSVNVREDVVVSELETAGGVVIVSNDVSNAKEALSIYRQKDVIEKGFLRLKTYLDLGRQRVHRDNAK